MPSDMTQIWASFSVELSNAPISLWIMLGECQVMCLQMAGSGLDPKCAKEINEEYLAKATIATTLLEGDLSPVVDRIVTTYREVENSLFRIGEPSLSPGSIRRINRTLSEGIPVSQSRNTGKVTESLLDDCCEWLNSEEFSPVEGMEMVCSIIRAFASHYYLTRIQPFAEKNGQTARLVEYQILTESGLPPCAAHSLANQYGLSRTEYQRHLNNTDRSNDRPIPFLLYAVRCLKAGLGDLLRIVQGEQRNAAWKSHVARLFPSAERREMERRRRDLVLDLSRMDHPVPLSGIKSISPRISGAYARKAIRTLMRDLETLQEMKLVEKLPAGYRARTEIVEVFTAHG